MRLENNVILKIKLRIYNCYLYGGGSNLTSVVEI